MLSGERALTMVIRQKPTALLTSFTGAPARLGPALQQAGRPNTVSIYTPRSCHMLSTRISPQLLPPRNLPLTLRRGAVEGAREDKYSGRSLEHSKITSCPASSGSACPSELFINSARP